MKLLTQTGKNFIRTICSGNSTSLITGKYKYNLPFSELENVSVNHTSNANDHLGDRILSNSQLGEALIFWFDKYAELNNLDANILAALTYQESKYRLWHYSKLTSGCGITNEISNRIYRFIINQENPDTDDEFAVLLFSSNEIGAITANTTGSSNSTNYIYKGRLTNQKLKIQAIKNRKVLYQNIINNPEIMIKLMSNIVKVCSIRNNYNTPSALFAYNRDYKIKNKSYINLVDQINKKYGDAYCKIGIDYVFNIFRILGDKNNNKSTKKIDKPKGIYFGYDNIDYTTNNFNAFLG